MTANSDSSSAPTRLKSSSNDSVLTDVQARLKGALETIDRERDQRRVLEAKASDLENQVEELKLEKSHLSARIRTYEDHISSLKTKLHSFRRDLTETQEICNMQRQRTDRLEAKLHRRTSLVKELSASIEQNSCEEIRFPAENEELRRQIGTLNRTNVALRDQNFELSRENEALASQKDALTIKIARLERKFETTPPPHNFVQLEAAHNDLQRRFAQSNRLVEDFQMRISTNSSQIDALSNENRDLKEQNHTLKAQIAKTERLEAETDSLHRELRETQDRAENSAAIIAELTRELREAKANAEDITATRIERDTLRRDVALLQERLKALNVNEAHGVQMALKVEDLTSRLSALAMRDKRQKEYIASLLHERGQLEVVRNELLKIEEEVRGREETEIKLKSQIAHYQAKVRQLSIQVQAYEEELIELRNKAFALQAEIIAAPVPVEAPVVKKGGHRETEKRLALKMKLETERKRNRTAENEIAELRRRVARYQTVFDEI
jgi:chromosome segregation ATPase